MAKSKKRMVSLNMEVELYDKLSNYCNAKGITVTRSINKALESFLQNHNVAGSEKDTIIKNVIENWLQIPNNTLAPRGILIVLYLLAISYPNDSSRAFWGDMVYISNVELSHKRLYDEIKNVIDKNLKKVSLNDSNQS